MRNPILLSIIAVLSIAASTSLSAQPIKSTSTTTIVSNALRLKEKAVKIYIIDYEIGEDHGKFTNGTKVRYYVFSGSEFFKSSLVIIEGSLTNFGREFFESEGYHFINERLMVEEPELYVKTLKECAEGDILRAEFILDGDKFTEYFYILSRQEE